MKYRIHFRYKTYQTELNGDSYIAIDYLDVNYTISEIEDVVNGVFLLEIDNNIILPKNIIAIQKLNENN